MNEWTPTAPRHHPGGSARTGQARARPGRALLWASRQTVRIPRAIKSWVGPAWAGGLFLVSGLTLAAFLGAFGPKFAGSTPCSAVSASSRASSGSCTIGLFSSWVETSLESRRTVQILSYALTDRRAIIWRPVAGSDGIEVYTYDRGKIGRLHRVEYPDGSGDVVFGLPNELHHPLRGFEGVAEVRRVEDLVRRTLMTGDSEAGPTAR